MEAYEAMLYESFPGLHSEQIRAIASNDLKRKQSGTKKYYQQQEYEKTYYNPY